MQCMHAFAISPAASKDVQPSTSSPSVTKDAKPFTPPPENAANTYGINMTCMHGFIIYHMYIMRKPVYREGLKQLASAFGSSSLSFLAFFAPLVTVLHSPFACAARCSYLKI